MKKVMLIGAAFAAIATSVMVLKLSANEATSPEAAAPEQGAPLVDVILPEQLSAQAQIGKTAFDAVCSTCHGANATGRMGFGPPLVHRIYEPSHHGDMAFQMAVQNGVKAHHWPFGNMPPQSGLTRSDVDAIVTYVRELQAANGIN